MAIKQNIKVAVDAVVFGYESNMLFILLIKQKFGSLKDAWVLPGGFVKNDEALSEAVQRELHEEAGIAVNYMEQLYTFGDDQQRDPRGRIISIAYFALVNPKGFSLHADTDAQDAQWFPVNKIPKLPFDHNLIIAKAKERLKSKLEYQPIGFDLLAKEFLFSDLENLYSTILERPLDRRNFRKKILSYQFLDETNKLVMAGAVGRPAQLFTFNKAKYNKLVRDGYHIDFKFA